MPPSKKPSTKKRKASKRRLWPDLRRFCARSKAGAPRVSFDALEALDPVLRIVSGLTALLSKAEHSQEARHAHHVAMRAAFALAGRTDDRIELAFNVLQGGRPTGDDGDGIAIRHVAEILERAKDVSTTGRPPWAVLYETRESLRQIDPALALADLEPLLQRVVDGGKISGIITDMLRVTLAVGTKPTESRTDVQKRVGAALKRGAPAI